MSAIPEQLHELLEYCKGFAELMLADSGEFLPFGASLGHDGKVSAVAGDIGSEHPDARELYAFLGGAFAEQALRGEIRGAAIAAIVNVPAMYESPHPDALRVQIEGIGYAHYIYVPFVLGKRESFGGKRLVSFAEPFAVEVQSQVFVTSDA